MLRKQKKPDCSGATITVVAADNPADFVDENRTSA
jgi:hypothetical protein